MGATLRTLYDSWTVHPPCPIPLWLQNADPPEPRRSQQLARLDLAPVYRSLGADMAFHCRSIHVPSASSGVRPRDRASCWLGWEG